MKECVIIVTILIIIIGGALYIQHYLNSTSTKIVSKLQNLKEIINTNENSNERQEIQEEAEKIYGEWSETKNKWAVLVFHSELDLIETSLVKMKAEIEHGELSEGLKEIDTSIFLIEHISETEKFCLKNIF